MAEDFLLHITSREDMYNLFGVEYTKRERKPLLKSMVLLTSQDPARLRDTVEESKRLAKRYSVAVKEIEVGFWGLSVSKKNCKNADLKVQALIDVKPSVWVVFTTADLYDTSRVLETLFEGLYPTFTFAYLNHHQVLSLIDEIKRTYHGQKVVAYFAIRTETETDGHLEIERKTLKSPRAEEQLIVEAKKARIWIDKLRFRIKNQLGMMVFDAVLTGRGLSRLIYGNFNDFYDNFVSSIVNINIDLDSKFSRVRRTEVDGDVQTSSCRITYPAPFKIVHLKNLASRLKSDYQLSIIHSGNPFFSADLLDCLDGSSFGLTMFGNTVTISPMLRTTNAALWKLVGKVQSVLGDGEIVI